MTETVWVVSVRDRIVGVCENKVEAIRLVESGKLQTINPSQSDPHPITDHDVAAIEEWSIGGQSLYPESRESVLLDSAKLREMASKLIEEHRQHSDE